MARIGWKTREQIEQERQAAEQVRQAIKQRRQRIKQGLESANSIAQIRALLKDIAEEIGLIKSQ